MKHQTRFVVVASICAIFAALAVGLLMFGSAAAPAQKAVLWRVQPDEFPLGNTLQGSLVEMSLGLFSGLNPAPLPAFFTRLPSPFRNASEWTAERIHALVAKMTFGVQVDGPVFVDIEHADVEVHSTQGPFVLISFRLKTDIPGECRSNMVVHIKGGAYGSTNVTIPMSVKVIGAAASASRAVLITETPYECYATGHGSDFEPVAALNSRLSEAGVRVDFCRQLPPSLAIYRVILLGGAELAGLGSAQVAQLGKFVAGGGRLILAANAFFVPTVPKANTLLSPYGLRILDQDDGLAITNSRVVSDLLTTGVKEVNFFRPSRIDVTDRSQGKLLVETGDGQGGYVAVSRQAPRGEVIVLTQSLWWSWIRPDPSKADNLLLLENLLTP